jgi:hypothetical protein
MLSVERGETETREKWKMMMMVTTTAVENESFDVRDEWVLQTKGCALYRDGTV